jgi:hypothetical protein
MSSLSGGLSDKQGAIVPYLLKLLRTLQKQGQNPSLETLRLIVDEKVKKPELSMFAGAIHAMPAVDQGFFKNQFYHSQMDATKQAIGWKIYSAMASDAFREMFSAKTNSVNFDQLIADCKVVLVKGARQSLGDDGMAIFLQFIIAQYFAAGMRRERIPPEQRHLCVMLCDEGSYVLNSPVIAKILVELRKYACGFVAATQVFEQIGTEIKAAVLGATAIKIVGPVSFSDANLLSRELGVGTPPEFIRSMKAVERSHADWAFYVSQMTDRAVKVKVPYGVLERMPKQKAPASQEGLDPITEYHWKRYQEHHAHEPAAAKQQMNEYSLRDTDLPLTSREGEKESPAQTEPPVSPTPQPPAADNDDEPLIKPGKDW